ncbi:MULTISPECIES: MobF family relaxase [unclassified Rhodanobacter]|uniref:MobF family relaxase n=2 Tax=Rhodanobacter TaxID=75309 RepID=UPI0009ED88BC|nr:MULTISPECIES: MobF family relaxase [unclassified Rhodanobacter]
MLTVTNLSGDDFREYILNDVVQVNETPNSATDYYAKKDGFSPFPNSFRLAGEAAKEWGLDGNFEDNKEIFTQLYDGIHPLTSKPLTQVQKKKFQKGDKVKGKNARKLEEGDKKIGEGKERRAGLDCTFSAPKSLSVALAKAKIDGDTALADAMLKAHREAVSYAMEEMGKGAVTRSGRSGVKKNKNNKLCYAMIDHFDARPVGDNSPDPQLHTHAILFNFGIDASGKCRAMEQLSINQQVKYGGALYRAKLAEGLQKAGLGIKNIREMGEFGPTDKVEMEVQGVGEEAMKAFSKRKMEVMDYMLKEKIDAKDIKKYLKKIRSSKGIMSYAEMLDDWKWQMNAMPADQFQFKSNQKDELSQIVDDQQILDYVHDLKKKTFVTEYDIKAVICQMYTGHPDAIQKIDETAKRIIEGDLITHLDKENGLGERLYCSKKLAVYDKIIMETVKKANSIIGKNQIPKKTIGDMVEKFQKERGFPPSKEQLEAIKALTGKENITVLRGLAGTGKTTACQVVAQSFAKEGWKCYGVAVSADAARHLEEDTGMKSTSIAKFLSDYERGVIKPDSNTFIYTDEVGMVDIETTWKLIDIQRRTGCRMSFGGDYDQLSPVGAGSGLKILDRCTRPAELTEIRRQKKIAAKRLGDNFYNINTKKDAKKMVEDMKSLDMVEKCESEAHAIEAIAKDYVKNKKDYADKLVMATTNDGVKYLNQMIQQELVKKGERSEAPLNTIGDYEYREGDKVRFNKRRRLTDANGNVKVINGDEGTVVGQDAQGRLLVQMDSGDEAGKRVSVPDNFDQLQLNYAVTVHKSQGKSIDDCYFYCDSQVNRNMGLVAYTRHKDNFKLYGKEEIIEGLKESLAMKDLSDGVYNFITKEDRDEVDRIYREEYEKLTTAPAVAVEVAPAVPQVQLSGIDPLMIKKASQVMEEQQQAPREEPEATAVEREVLRVARKDRWSKAPSKLRKEVREEVQKKKIIEI